ncbi:ammonium transporter 3 member 1-like [Prunus yedoensis var. nudiflora]|uniref:Ammonium transporter 3 member 1-like n=1 Tax=Prunus yedoensis var. nudiflora TaxID=2094558 RepID=A0A314Z9M3_PRUYE|nr:ammonium transporter 3 member 1-like [Prunus yedoensis var. nudiflora]
MEQQRRQCMAANSNHHGRHAECSWPCHTLWKHGEEEMGCKLSFHGPIRLCCSPHLLGSLGSQHVIWYQILPNIGQPGFALTKVGAFSIWGKGFLEKYIIDYAGGYVIHLSSGVAGFTAYWVGPRQSHDRQHFPPNNIIHMLGGAGFLWLGWTGFNGGSPFAANLIASLAIINTHICTATSLLVWVSFDMVVYKKSSVIGGPGDDHWPRLYHTWCSVLPNRLIM